MRITSRWKLIDHAGREELKDKQFIIAFWHGRLLMIPPMAPGQRKINVLISHHRDGELIAKVQHLFRFNTIRGSSSKGALVALKQIIAAKKRGENIAITPDGPRGPAQKVGGNVVKIAKMLELPIVPVSYSFENAKRARSWDRFMIPRPFGQGVWAIGKPIAFEEAETLEEALNELTNEVDLVANNI